MEASNTLRRTVLSMAARLTLALVVGVPVTAWSESFLGGLKDRATMATERAGQAAGNAADTVGNAAGAVVDRASETLDSAKRDLRDEATPADTRAKLDAMAQSTLARLWSDEPEGRALFDESAGYAVFDTRQVTYVVAAGYGRGVAVNRATGRRTYMKAGTAGAGLSIGLGGFDTQFVILVESAGAFERFIAEGLDATAEVGTMIGDDREQRALRFQDGRAVFVLTQKGWKVSAKLSGTKYWPDADLN